MFQIGQFWHTILDKDELSNYRPISNLSLKSAHFSTTVLSNA